MSGSIGAWRTVVAPYRHRDADGECYLPATRSPYRYCSVCGSTWNPLPGNTRPDRCPTCCLPGCPEVEGADFEREVLR